MAGIKRADARIINRTVLGDIAEFTVPASNDYTDNTWVATDLALSEIGVAEDLGKAFIRIGEEIKEICLDCEDTGTVPPGGETGQVLTKSSNTDYDTEWTTPATGGFTTYDKPTGQILTSFVGANDMFNFPFTGMITVKVFASAFTEAEEDLQYTVTTTFRLVTGAITNVRDEVIEEPASNSNINHKWHIEGSDIYFGLEGPVAQDCFFTARVLYMPIPSV